MTIFYVLSAVASYLGLVIVIFGKVSTHNKSVNKKFETVAIENAVTQTRIETIEKEVDKKANKELVEQQFTTINDSLKEIKDLLKSKRRVNND